MGRTVDSLLSTILMLPRRRRRCILPISLQLGNNSKNQTFISSFLRWYQYTPLNMKRRQLITLVALVIFQLVFLSTIYEDYTIRRYLPPYNNNDSSISFLQQIFIQLPIDLWSYYESSLQTNPIITKTIINTVIYLISDWISQTILQGRTDIFNFDISRTLKNGFVGLCFGTPVHYYYEFSDFILPLDGVTLGITNRLYKILMDQSIYCSIKFSIYIMAISSLNGEGIQSSINNVQNRIRNVMFTSLKFWPIVHCITYWIIPSRHRVLWVNCVDLFVWIPILTLKARKNVDEEEYAVAKKKKENESNQLSAMSSLSTYNSTESKDSDTSLGIVTI